jgi:hypothetical protein
LAIGDRLFARSAWKAGRYKLAAPVSKTGSALRRGRSITDAFRQFHHQPSTLNQEPIMKPVLRYQSQLLFRKSYKPSRVLRIRPARLSFVFRPVRFGLKPKIESSECKTT